MSATSRVPVGQYLANLNMGLSHHRAWLQRALEQLIQLDPGALDRDRELYEVWAAAVPEKPGLPLAQGPLVSEEVLRRATATIKAFEGYRSFAYPDPGTGGEPWTVGYGCTRWRDGRPVRRGDVVTPAEAHEQLQAQLAADFAPVLVRKVPGFLDLTINQQAALLSFAWNCGAAFYGAAGFETITRLLRDRTYWNVPEALLLYVNPGSNVEAGLRARRRAEGQLWTLPG